MKKSAVQSKRQNTRKKQKRTTARISFKQAKPKPAVPVVTSQIYWPDRIDYVKAVAARGLSDVEMAEYLGISADLLDSWKVYYPLLNKAIEEGRSQADVEVVAALHKNAVGYDYETDEVVRGRGRADVVTVTKHVPGDTNAQKFWLMNRSSAWRAGQQHAVGLGGRSDAPAIGVKVDAETKMMVIHSILNMITPRPDGDGRPPKLIEGKS